jgi:hypothetical protein
VKLGFASLGPPALLIRCLPAGVALAATLAGCGGSTTTIDQQNLQTAIAISIAQQKHIMSIVQCPKGIQAKKGVTLTCTATLASGQQIPFSVVGTDAKGNVHYGGFPTPVSTTPGSSTTTTTGSKKKKK